jgi:hypothetical protein
LDIDQRNFEAKPEKVLDRIDAGLAFDKARP